MKLFNTLSRQIEEFVPQNPPAVSFYACGPTVYDYTHIGHLRKYVMDDVLLRTLEHQGYEVKFVQNITNVGHLTSDGDTGDDKLEKGAKKYGKSAWDVAREFEEYFWRSVDLMGNKRPDVSSRATEHIDEQLDLVRTLEVKGYTYEISGDGIYFDTSKLADYGKLARLNVEEQQEGARIGVVEGKRNPTDFALWKFERPGEDRAMVWPSRWHERSFPGWHIECSAMSMKYLGEQIDIHTGGIDHIPVHHTNEIAQSEAATGQKPFVRYWVHHNFLLVEGEKMSKSLGNFYTIDDILERGFDPRALRLLFLTSHYRSELNFTWESMAGAQKAYEKLLRQVQELQAAGNSSLDKSDLGPQGLVLNNRFFDNLSEDLGTPEAVAVMWEVVSADLERVEKLWLLNRFDQVLNLNLIEAAKATNEKVMDYAKLPEEIQGLITRRAEARELQNWSESDRLRNLLAEKGYAVTDSRSGQTVQKLNN